MSARPIRRKQANKLRKAFRKELPRFMDLVQWLKDHGYAQTTGEANRIILAKRVKSESHVVGVTKAKVPTSLTIAQVAMGKTPTFEEREVVQRFVPAGFRSTLTVLPG